MIHEVYVFHGINALCYLEENMRGTNRIVDISIKAKEKIDISINFLNTSYEINYLQVAPIVS